MVGVVAEAVQLMFQRDSGNFKGLAFEIDRERLVGMLMSSAKEPPRLESSTSLGSGAGQDRVFLRTLSFG